MTSSIQDSLQSPVPYSSSQCIVMSIMPRHHWKRKSTPVTSGGGKKLGVNNAVYSNRLQQLYSHRICREVLDFPKPYPKAQEIQAEAENQGTRMLNWFQQEIKCWTGQLVCLSHFGGGLFAVKATDSVRKRQIKFHRSRQVKHCLHRTPLTKGISQISSLRKAPPPLDF